MSAAAEEHREDPAAEPVFAITLFDNHSALTKREEKLSLEALRCRVVETKASEKARLPWLKMARFGTQRTEKGSLRHDENLIALSGLEADYDGGEVSFDEAVETISKAGMSALLYTSPSHDPETPRWRVLAPFSVEILPDRRDAMMGRLNGLFRGILAGESWTRSQSYYYGSVDSNPAHQAVIVAGTPVDQIDELDEIWLGKTERETHSAPKPRGKSSKKRTYRSKLNGMDEVALLEQLISGAAIHNTYLVLLGRWARMGVTAGEASDRIRAAMEDVVPPDRDARWQSRYDDIERSVYYVFKKDKKRRQEEGEAGQGPPAADEEDGGPTLKGPKIRIVAGKLHYATTAAEASITKAGLAVYQRGDGLVRPVTREVPASRGRTTIAACLGKLNVHSMIDILSATAKWERFDARSNAWCNANPPSQVAQILLSREGQWRLPTIAGIVTTPTLRPDGSLLREPGYDPATRLYHVADPTIFLNPAVDNPTRQDAENALADLGGLLAEFPFVKGDEIAGKPAVEVSKAVALSGLITPVVRGALSVAPLHAFRAHTAGTGKSYLADLVTAISSGRACPVSTAAKDEAETEKRIASLLLDGFPVVNIDNCNGELGGDILAQAVERPLIRIRPLGVTKTVEIESRATIFATGNNLRVRGDMVRRTIICDLDAGVERPELRKFEGNPFDTVLANRGRYVSAALIIVRAYLAAGCPDLLPSIASFDDWSGCVRSALVWLGCSDPAQSMDAAREDDPELGELRELLGLWIEEFAINEKVPLRDVAEAAERRERSQMGEPTDHANPEFRDALLRVAADRGTVSTKRLAAWLRSREGRIAGGLRFKRGLRGGEGGVVRWGVERV